MQNEHLVVVKMDVARDKETLFNDIYDDDHIPEIQKLSSVSKVTRLHTNNRAEPRYMAVYETDDPSLPETTSWQKAADVGRWKPEVRPYTMNRYSAAYSWVGGNRELTYETKYWFLAMMDVEAHKEDLFNEIYEVEHLPQISKVPGVINTIRFKTTAARHPKYMAIYEIEGPDVRESPAWTKASDTGRWKPEIRPYTYNKHNNLYERMNTR